MLDYIFLIIIVAAISFIVENFIIHKAIEKNCEGYLVLIEEEEDNETYAFMELNTSVEKIKEKRYVRLKIDHEKVNTKELTRK